jgi:hypothetical protein
MSYIKRNILNSANACSLILNLKNFFDLIFKLIVLMNIFNLGKPVKSSENSNESFNNPQPNNPQPNNPQTNIPQSDNPQSDNPQSDQNDQIKQSILQKIHDRINDQDLDRKTNIFNKTGKSHDFTAEEEDYITNGLNVKLE